MQGAQQVNTSRSLKVQLGWDKDYLVVWKTHLSLQIWGKGMVSGACPATWEIGA